MVATARHGISTNIDTCACVASFTGRAEYNVLVLPGILTAGVWHGYVVRYMYTVRDAGGATSPTD